MLSNSKKVLRNLNVSFPVAYPQDVVIIHDFHDTTPLAKSIPGYSDTFNSLGLFMYSYDVRKLLLRLLLQPSRELFVSIHNVLSRYDLRDSIAIQIRVGGSLATSDETSEFLPILNMKEYLQQINSQYSHNETIFCSTDSSSLVPLIKRLLSNHTVIQSKGFSIGHSRSQSKRHLDGMKRAVVDLILSANCKTIYTTMKSSYGMLIRLLSLKSGIKVFEY